MKYCKKCMLLTDEIKCPLCNTKKLVDANIEDPVYLITKEMIWSEMISDVLNENNIPYLKHGNLGPALSVMMGNIIDYCKFYVPYGEYDKASELMKDLFPSDYSDYDIENENFDNAEDFDME